MSEVNKLIEELMAPAKEPEKWIRSEMARTGRAAAGTFLGFCPEELLYSAGFLPVCLWGEESGGAHASGFFPAFFCAPIQNMFNCAAAGAYTGLLKAVIMPVYCDSLRSAGQNLKIAIPDIPVISVVYPANRKSDSGIRFLAEEYEGVRKELERITGKEIKEETLEQTVKIYNRYRSVMRALLAALAKHPELLSPSERHLIIKSACYADKKSFADKAQKLVKALEHLPGIRENKKNVILTGIMLEQPEILETMDALNMSVISDYLLQESLQLQIDIPLRYEGETDACLRMAYRFSELSYCSVAADPEKTRIEKIAEEAAAQNASVIVCIPSFCNPEEYDYPLLKQELEERRIRHVCLELHTESSVERARTSLQALSEML